MVQLFAILTSHDCIASPTLSYGNMKRAANHLIYDEFIRKRHQKFD